jgi:hypothetical protein
LSTFICFGGNRGTLCRFNPTDRYTAPGEHQYSRYEYRDKKIIFFSNLSAGVTMTSAEATLRIDGQEACKVKAQNKAP